MSKQWVIKGGQLTKATPEELNEVFTSLGYREHLSPRKKALLLAKESYIQSPHSKRTESQNEAPLKSSQW